MTIKFNLITATMSKKLQVLFNQQMLWQKS